MASEPVTGWGVDLGGTTIEVVVPEIENAETENAARRLQVLIVAADREARPRCPA